MIQINDFSYYWVSGKLLLSNSNPYSFSEFIQLQKANYIPYETTLQFNYPPWSINWFLPFTNFEPLLGYQLWKIFALIILSVCALISYDFIKKESDSRYDQSIKLILTSLALVVFAYADFLWSNVNFIVLFGVLIYLKYTYHSNNSKYAGLGLSLIIIKPNLLLAFLFYAFVSSISKRDKAFCVYFTGAVIFQLVLPAVFNPTIYLDYIDALPIIVQKSAGYDGFSLALILKGYLPFRNLSTSMLLISVIIGSFCGLMHKQSFNLALVLIPVSLLLSPHTIFTSVLLLFPCIVLTVDYTDKLYHMASFILWSIAIFTSTLASNMSIIYYSFYMLMILTTHQVLINCRSYFLVKGK